jgi:hypothetical protein
LTIQTNSYPLFLNWNLLKYTTGKDQFQELYKVGKYYIRKMNSDSAYLQHAIKVSLTKQIFQKIEGLVNSANLARKV